MALRNSCHLELPHSNLSPTYAHTHTHTHWSLSRVRGTWLRTIYLPCSPIMALWLRAEGELRHPWQTPSVSSFTPPPRAPLPAGLLPWCFDKHYQRGSNMGQDNLLMTHRLRLLLWDTLTHTSRPGHLCPPCHFTTLINTLMHESLVAAVNADVLLSDSYFGFVRWRYKKACIFSWHVTLI